MPETAPGTRFVGHCDRGESALYFLHELRACCTTREQSGRVSSESGLPSTPQTRGQKMKRAAAERRRRGGRIIIVDV
jgi:hypothetical protein